MTILYMGIGISKHFFNKKYYDIQLRFLNDINKSFSI